MATRMGDAYENGDENIYNQQSQPKRRPTKFYSGPKIPHHGFVFEAFTRDSLINIEKRKSSKAKKHSVTYLDPAKSKQPDPYLASGQQLPPALIRQLPPELVGKPIVDIDPYYADQETFVIISRSKELTRFSATKALCLLGPFHPIRRVVLYILVNPIFNLLVILTILTNCILMTIQGSETVEKTEIIFTIVYTTEMGLKVLARGFFIHKFTYLRDAWNWLDFGVIIMAYLTIVVQDLGNLSVMRTFRVLRALKTVAIISGMKTIVGAVIDSVKNLKDVVVLTLFSLSVFSLIGLQIYMGQLTQKCILNGPTNMTDNEWFNWCSNNSHWISEPDDEIFGAYRLCGNATGAQSCPIEHTCIQGFGPNPDYGFTNFDTFGWSLICSFRLMTQDFWEGLYMQILKTAGSWHIVFFIISIFLGSIYLMNLILAIVAMSYNELQRRAEEEEEAAAEDEAAFLESCRLMELQEQMSDITHSSMGGGRTSYRPSVEIGLVGQSLLASLCQNGLLGQHVRNRLNQQMMLPGMTNNTNIRSHSLSVNYESNNNEAHNIADNGRENELINKGNMKRTSMVPCSYRDPLTMASSCTELRRKSSVRTISSGSPVHLLIRHQVMLPSSGETRSATFNQHHTNIQETDHPNSKLSTQRKFSSFQISQSEQQQQQLDSSKNLIISQTGQRSTRTRTSTTSDRDLHILRQRAALIRIVSDDHSLQKPEDNKIMQGSQHSALSTESSEKSSTASSNNTTTTTNDHHPPIEGYQNINKTPNRMLAGQYLTTNSNRRRRSEMERSSALSDNNYLNPVNLKSRTKSHDYSLERSIREDDETKRYFGRVAARSEAVICSQPRSIHSFTVTSTPSENSPQWQKRRFYDVNSKSSDQSNSIDRSISSNGSYNIDKDVVPNTQSNNTIIRRPGIGGSTRTLHSNNSPTTTMQRLSIERCLEPGKMHHLSVENFQQFGANRPTHQQLVQSQHHHNPRQQQRCDSAGCPSRQLIDPEQIEYELASQASRGRLESRSHIHPSTMMMRSSFARPRQSVMNDPSNGTSGKRMSQDFVRRASEWSRLSMSTNVDLRRLLRLWSHTNPYQGRPSIGSFQSNLSQPTTVGGLNARFVSTEGSMRDFNSYGYLFSQNNTPPSSISSARHAYELVSAFSRRQSQFPSDQRCAMPLDDNMIDQISVNMRDKCLAYCLSCLDILCIWECCGVWIKIQKLISIVVFDPFTELFIILCILINTLFMALDSDDADAQMKNIFERGNYFFTATFAVEASMKIMALSPKFYFREGWNVFDSIIVGLSLLELGLEGVYGLSVLRSFRLLRVFKLAKSWPTLNLLISIMGKAVGDLGNLTFVLAIIVFIFAVMGMQLFGNKYVDHNFPSGELPRWNFTDFMHSFMIVFRILCAEWIEPMWDCLLVGGWPCIPFFLIAVTVGNLVVLNLFLALLLASFGASNLSSPQADNVDTKKLQSAIARFSRFCRWIKKKIGYLINWIISCILGRNKRKQDNLSSNHRESSVNGKNDSKRGSVKSHIAAMSKLERLKNIELRTEELKSKIKRSPEHHYHLKRLAKSQIKKETNSTNQHDLLEPYPTTSRGFNYNYKFKNFLREDNINCSTCGNTGEGTGGIIPIIVNEATENNDDFDDVKQDHCSIIIDSPTICLSPSISQEVSEFNENQASIADLYNSKLITQQNLVNNDNNDTKELSTVQVQQIFRQVGGSRHSAAYSINMQPIREDSRDADSSASLSSDCEAVNNKTKLNKLAQYEASSCLSSRWKFQLAQPVDIDKLESNDSEQNKITQKEDIEDKSESSLEERLVKLETGGDYQLQVDLLNGEQEEEESHKEGEEDETEQRPQSSLYLKAPKREDMEEEDERDLQHIESYIEKCICVGILCLKWFLFRQHVRKIVEHRYFDQCILALIVISSGTLALEDKHLNERPTLKRTLDVLDTLFTIIFSLEMIFKWLAFGIKRYFGNMWSWLDFVIVLVSFINLMASIFGSGKIQALKTMRTLRAMRGLRPLRALQRFQGMRVVVNALIQAIPSIFNVLLVCLIFWLIFSIMGVQMFGGKFWRCLNPVTYKVVSFEEAANQHECLERNLTWANPQINFDNVLNAYLALFQVATFKGWIDIMNSATDSRMRDDQPIREANIYMYFYFVFFVIFGSFFTLNLFIGVIIDNFNEQKKKTGGSLEIFMTDDQKKYYHAMKKMRSKRPVKAMTRPRFKFQAYMFDITTSKKFDMAIMIIIGLNMFVMALEHYGQSQEFSLVLENLNLIFIAIFTLECLCKIFAMRHFYFREPWNIFDFIVVDLSILGVVMKEYVAKYFVSPTLLRVVRVVKVGRVLRLVKGAKGIRTLLFALAMSLPALFNICLLLFLVMFIYAIFGMSFFMNVRPRSGIDETFNFETFTSSIIVLFQMSTSAGWDLVLDPLMDEENDCQKPDPAQGIEGTCGNKSIAIFYLISYVIVTFLIIINMYIAVILENYSQATEDVQEGLTDDDYEMYYEIWQKFDPDGTQYLKQEKLSDFVDALEDPLRIPKPNELALVILDINIYEGRQCYCVDILDALTKYFFTRKGLIIQVDEHLQKVQSTLHETPFKRISTTYLMKREHYCASVIQKCWRKWREQSITRNIKN